MANNLVFVFILCRWLAVFITVTLGQEQFLCYSCTYTSNPSLVHYECVTSPENYTGGENEVPCPNDQICHIERTISLFTGEVEILTRGCGYRTDGCDSDGYSEECTETCGTHLCNNRNAAPPKTTVTGSVSSTTKDPNTFIECWNCDYDADVDGGNDICVTDPAAVPPEEDKPNTARCNAGDVCIIFRTHKTDSHRVQLMSRTCDSYNIDEDYCAPSATGSETCVTTCNTDFCNDGDGIVGAAEKVIPIFTLSILSSLVVLLTL